MNRTKLPGAVSVPRNSQALWSEQAPWVAQQLALNQFEVRLAQRAARHDARMASMVERYAKAVAQLPAAERRALRPPPRRAVAPHRSEVGRSQSTTSASDAYIGLSRWAPPLDEQRKRR